MSDEIERALKRGDLSGKEDEKVDSPLDSIKTHASLVSAFYMGLAQAGVPHQSCMVLTVEFMRNAYQSGGIQ